MQEILSKKLMGERIKALRIEYAYPQVHIANLLNLSRSNYSQIELGYQYPTFNTLNALSKHYKKSYEWLLHGEEKKDRQLIKHNEAALLNDLEVTLKTFSNSLKKLEIELQSIKKQISVS